MIFVDSSFWIALAFRRDTHHRDAARLVARHGEEALVTTNLVRGESWTFVRDRMGHRHAVALLDHIDSSRRVEVAHVDEVLEADATAWLRQRDERAYSFVDAASFAFMRARKLTDALTFDEDFAAAGFVPLRP